MKKQLLILPLITVMGVISWGNAQSGSSAPFDLKKSQQELEIMSGILNTTIGFVADESRSTGSARRFSRNWWSSNVSAFYLYGQGAVFLIPVSSLRPNRMLGSLNEMKAWQSYESLEGKMDEMRAALQANNEALDSALQAQKEAEEAAKAAGLGQGVAGGVSGGVVGGVVVPVPAPPAAPPPPPEPPKTPFATTIPRVGQAHAGQQEIKKRLAEAQEAVKKRQEEYEKQREKLMEAVSQVKVHLIEALANYGDSLTIVKPDEYISLILSGDDSGLVFAGLDESKSVREIISVQKSVITDYKAGRLSLDAFKQKVLQYQE
jgi:hypothetical protein